MISNPLKFMEIEDSINRGAESNGLIGFGWFRLDDQRVGLLVGNVGSALWRPFTSSGYAFDGKPDPLNRWTQSVIEPMATRVGGEAVFPFGETVWPFQQWAKQSMGLENSPLGLLIHFKYGLWFAFRGAILIDDTEWQAEATSTVHPCDCCEAKPCLTTCPVDAVSVQQFDVGRCHHYLKSRPLNGCVSQGCIARRACPVGRDFAYHADHQAFHMEALN